MMAKLLDGVKRWFRQQATPHYPYPAMDIDISADLSLHLVGSIHMGSENMAPLPQPLLDKLAAADALIVEADVTDNRSPFRPNSDIQFPPMQQRLSADDYARFMACCKELQQPSDSFDLLPAWQIALILQATQAQRLGLRPEYGIDYQLLRVAHGHATPVIELEGIDSQVELLLQMPEHGIDLLRDTLLHWRTNARSLQLMLSWWLNFQPRQEDKLPMTFSQDMYDILMRQRNLLWQKKLMALPAGKYVVAVGALHLYGEGNLVELLRH